MKPDEYNIRVNILFLMRFMLLKYKCSFKIKEANAGDSIKVSWVDNLGETSSGDIVLK